MKYEATVRMPSSDGVLDVRAERVTLQAPVDLGREGYKPLTSEYELPRESRLLRRVVEDMERGDVDYLVRFEQGRGYAVASVWRIPVPMPREGADLGDAGGWLAGD